VPPAGTNALKALSQNLLSRVGPADQIGITRLHDAADKVATEPETAMALIGSFTAGSVPFVPDETPEAALHTMARLARTVGAAANRRKGIVCVGSPVLCGQTEVSNQAARGLYPAWVEAVTAAGQANVAFYGIIPQNARINGGTLAQATGGQLFVRTSAFDEAFDRIWSELSRYYLVGYRAASSSRDLPQIAVKVARRGVDVRTRARRGKAGA
jgi:hypothetical protein